MRQASWQLKGVIFLNKWQSPIKINNTSLNKLHTTTSHSYTCTHYITDNNPVKPYFKGPLMFSFIYSAIVCTYICFFSLLGSVMAVSLCNIIYVLYILIFFAENIQTELDDLLMVHNSLTWYSWKYPHQNLYMARRILQPFYTPVDSTAPEQKALWCKIIRLAVFSTWQQQKEQKVSCVHVCWDLMLRHVALNASC